MPEDETGYVTATGGDYVHTYTPAGAPDYARDYETAVEAIRKIDIERREHEAKRRMWEQIVRALLAAGWSEALRRRVEDLLG
jgi:hypothetical protein